MFGWFLLVILSLQTVSGPTFTAAKEQFLSRHFAEAAASLRELIRAEPGNVRARYLLVRTLIEDNRASQALEEAELTAKEYPREALAQVALGDARFRLAGFDGAQTAYEEAVRLDGKEPRAHLGLGRVLLSDFRFKTAKEQLQIAQSLDPKDPDIALALSSVTADPEERIRLEEQFAVEAGYRDPEELEGTKALISLYKLRAGKRPFLVDNAPKSLSLALEGAPPQNMRPSAFVLRVSLNGGEPARLLLDTGAHGIVISARLAGLNSIEQLVPYRLGGLGDVGRTQASLGWADSLIVDGKLRLSNCPVIIADTNTGPMWDGIIGTDVFRDFLLSLDFPNRVLRIEKVAGMATYDYSWDRGGQTPADAAGARLAEGKLLLKTEVNGRGAGYFLLDTGAGQTLINRRLAETVTNLKSSRKRIGGISGEVQEVLRTEELLLKFVGLESRTSLAVVDLSSISYALGVEVSGLIGCDLLRDARLTIDYRNGFITTRPSRPGIPAGPR